MDFLIKLGETGQSFIISNISSNDRVAILMDRIRGETRIENRDQILLTKKGFKLKAEDVLAVIENENIFQTTLHSDLSNRQKQTPIIYVFNEKALNNSDSSLKDQNKENLIKDFISINELADDCNGLLIASKIIEKDYLKSFLQEFPEAHDEFKVANGNIFNIEEALFKQYQTIRKKYIEYTQRMKKLDKAVNECENQMQSFDVILKETSQCYQVVKVKKNDIQRRMKENLEKNSFTVKKFEESIENLKKIELHDQLKTEKVKVLLDVYYEPEAMVQWKNNCINNQANLKAKTDKITNYIKSMKKKIKEERNSNIANGITLYKTQKEKYESLFQETDAIMISLFTEIYDEYRALRKNIELLSMNPENQNALNFLELVSGKVGNYYNEQISVCDENNDKLIKLFENVIKTKSDLGSLIVQEYHIMHKFIFELTSFAQEKIRMVNEDIERMEKEFSYLLSPLSLPNAYQASLAEISRRRDFFSYFEAKKTKFTKLIELEKDRRKKFLSNFGKILPSEFIPQLKSMPPSFEVKMENVLDASLPKIDGYHSENDKYSNKKKLDKIKALEKELSDLRDRPKSPQDSSTFLYRELDEINRKISTLSLPPKDSSLSQQDPLRPKLQSLIDLLQQTSRFSQSLLVSKIREKQQEIDSIKVSYENQLMRFEDLLIQERGKFLSDAAENERIRKEMKTMKDLLKINEEKIRSLNEIRSSMSKENGEMKERLVAYEKKTKIEHTEVLSKIHDLHRGEVEKLKSRIKSLETDFFNKSTEVEKASKQITDLMRELRLKSEESERKSFESQSLSSNNHKLKEEYQKLCNRLENTETQLNSQVTTYQKQTKELAFEKTTLQNENNTLRQQLSEAQTKYQRTMEALKNTELEKESFKTRWQKLTTELEKRQNCELSLDKQQEQLMMLSDELARKKLEFNMVETRVELLSAELETKTQTLAVNESEINGLKEENVEFKRNVENLESQLNEERVSYNMINQSLSDFKMINEHLQAELEFSEEKLRDSELNLKAIQTKYEDVLRQMSRNEEDLMKKNGVIKEKEEVIIERDEAFQQRNEALQEKEEALQQRNEAIQQRDEALQQREEALKQRDEAFERREETLQEKDEALKQKDDELQQKEGVIAGLEAKNQDLFNEIGVQESLYKEEIKSLGKELGNAKGALEITIKELVSVREEYQSLKNKETLMDSQVETAVLKEIKSEGLDSMIEYSSLTIGARYVFIPVTQGIYSPLILRQINTSFTLNDTHDEFNVKSYKNNYFLDVESIDPKYKDLILECSLIIIAKVKDFKEVAMVKPENSSSFNLKPNEGYTNVLIESPEFIIGFEGDDFALKNFAF